MWHVLNESSWRIYLDKSKTETNNYLNKFIWSGRLSLLKVFLKYLSIFLCIHLFHLYTISTTFFLYWIQFITTWGLLFCFLHRPHFKITYRRGPLLSSICMISGPCELKPWKSKINRKIWMSPMRFEPRTSQTQGPETTNTRPLGSP